MKPRMVHRVWLKRLICALLAGVVISACWVHPNDWQFQLDNGLEFRGAIVAAPREAAGAGAVYRVRLLGQTDAGGGDGLEIEIDAASLVSQTPHESPWLTIWRLKWRFTACLAAAVGAAVVCLWWISRSPAPPSNRQPGEVLADYLRSPQQAAPQSGKDERRCESQ